MDLGVSCIPLRLLWNIYDIDGSGCLLHTLRLLWNIYDVDGSGSLSCSDSCGMFMMLKDLYLLHIAFNCCGIFMILMNLDGVSEFLY